MGKESGELWLVMGMLVKVVRRIRVKVCKMLFLG